MKLNDRRTAAGSWQRENWLTNLLSCWLVAASRVSSKLVPLLIYDRWRWRTQCRAADKESCREPLIIAFYHNVRSALLRIVSRSSSY